MTPEQSANLNAIARECHENSRRAGWYDNPPSVAVRVALIHSEVSELLEADRHGNPPSDHLPQFSAAAEEMADILIRVLDMAASTGVDFIGEVVAAKLAYNRNRPPKHGGKLY